MELVWVWSLYGDLSFIHLFVQQTLDWQLCTRHPSLIPGSFKDEIHALGLKVFIMKCRGQTDTTHDCCDSGMLKPQPVHPGEVPRLQVGDRGVGGFWCHLSRACEKWLKGCQVYSKGRCFQRENSPFIKVLNSVLGHEGHWAPEGAGRRKQEVRVKGKPRAEQVLRDRD